MRLASFPWSGSSNESRAIFQGLLAVKGALRGKSIRLKRKDRLGNLTATFSKLDKENKQENYFSEYNSTYIQHSHQLTEHSFKPWSPQACESRKSCGWGSDIPSYWLNTSFSLLFGSWCLTFLSTQVKTHSQSCSHSNLGSLSLQLIHLAVTTLIKSNSLPTLRWHICSQTVAGEKKKLY